MCINDKLCYDSEFLSVVKVQQNYWLTEQDVGEVGGILGLAYECHTCNSLWAAEAYQGLPEFGIFLDWETDLDWWTKATGSTKMPLKPLLTLGS